MEGTGGHTGRGEGWPGALAGSIGAQSRLVGRAWGLGGLGLHRWQEALRPDLFLAQVRQAR